MAAKQKKLKLPIFLLTNTFYVEGASIWEWKAWLLFFQLLNPILLKTYKIVETIICPIHITLINLLFNGTNTLNNNFVTPAMWVVCSFSEVGQIYSIKWLLAYLASDVWVNRMYGSKELE